jgi:cyclopropane fatty-acyl-phospholipid synthase-like methyltransferase
MQAGIGDESYTYHGDDSGLSTWDKTFTSRNGDGSGDAEENFHAAIKLIAACKAGGAFLDVGSGLGRIVKQLWPDAGTVTGLEPDLKRYLACRNRLSGRDHVDVLNMTSWDYRKRFPERRFDFTTVSMVVQHVSTQACRDILRDVREFMAPGGVAMISTTHFFEERFTYEMDLAPHAATEFDRYADASEHQDKGIPVRMFSKASLLAEIEQAGLQVVDWRQFSYVRPEKVEGMASMFGVPIERLRDFGLSQYAVVRRAPPPPRQGSPPLPETQARGIRRLLARRNRVCQP